jgi:hypothetical protein
VVPRGGWGGGRATCPARLLSLAVFAQRAASVLCSCLAQTHPPPEARSAALADGGNEDVSAVRSGQGARGWCRGGGGPYSLIGVCCNWGVGLGTWHWDACGMVSVLLNPFHPLRVV